MIYKFSPQLPCNEIHCSSMFYPIYFVLGVSPHGSWIVLRIVILTTDRTQILTTDRTQRF